MEKAPWPMTNWEDGMMSTIFSSPRAGWSVNSAFPLYLLISFSIGSVLSILFCYHADCLDWGNFVGCRWVFSNQVPFLFFNKSFACFRQTLNFWQNIKSLIAHVFSSLQFSLSQVGLWLWTSSCMKEGGLSYDVEVLTFNEQGDEIILLKIGPPTVAHRRSILTSSFPVTPYTMSHLILFFCSQPFVCLFVCYLRSGEPRCKVDLLDGEAQPQPLQFEAGIFWKGGEGEEKSRQSA